MTRDQFWQLIDSIRSRSGADMDARIEFVRDELCKLAPKEVIDYTEHFDALFHDAYSWDLWGAAYIIFGGCSDDAFMDFRSNLISMGRKIFEEALANPDSLADLPRTECESLETEGFAYITRAIRGEKTEFEMPRRGKGISDEPSGRPWDENDAAELKKRFPRLYKMYW